METCRICHDGTDILISPCACKGSLAFVHRACIEQWHAMKVQRLGTTDGLCSVCRTPETETVAFDVVGVVRRVAEADARNWLLCYVEDGDKRARAEEVLQAGLIREARRVPAGGEQVHALYVVMTVLCSFHGVHGGHRNTMLAMQDGLRFAATVVGMSDEAEPLEMLMDMYPCFSMDGKMLLLLEEAQNVLDSDLSRVERIARAKRLVIAAFKLGLKTRACGLSSKETVQVTMAAVLGCNVVLMEDALREKDRESVQAAAQVTAIIFESTDNMWAHAPVASSRALQCVVHGAALVRGTTLGQFMKCSSAQIAESAPSGDFTANALKVLLRNQSRLRSGGKVKVLSAKSIVQEVRGVHEQNPVWLATLHEGSI